MVETFIDFCKSNHVLFCKTKGLLLVLYQTLIHSMVTCRNLHSADSVARSGLQDALCTRTSISMAAASHYGSHLMKVMSVSKLAAYERVLVMCFRLNTAERVSAEVITTCCLPFCLSEWYLF